MGRKQRELTVGEKERIAALYDASLKGIEISKLMNIPKSTVYNFIKRYASTGSIENKHRSGRPREFTVRDRSRLLRCVKSDRKRTLNEISYVFNENKQRHFSKYTLRKELHRLGYRKRVVKKKLRVSDVNRKKRVTWCLNNRSKTVHGFWKRVIFSDECKVVIGQDQRVCVWRKVGEEWQADCLCPPSKRKLSLMLWGCVTFDGVGTLTVVDGNIDARKYIEVLDLNVWPVIAKNFPQNDYIFQDDNAPVHRARIVQHYRQEHGLKSMFWPAQSPDLNIIENLWLLLKREVQRRVDNIGDLLDLERELRDIWSKITPQYIQSLYFSLPRRILRVLRSKGHITKY